MNFIDFLSPVQLALVAISSLFFIVDPIATIPVFLYMTSDAGPRERSRMARSAALTCFFVLAGFSLVGALLFRLLGITLPAFQTAGGVILLLVGLDMVQARRSGTKEVPGEAEEGVVKSDAGIVPLGMPMLAGPGAISNVVVLVGQASRWWETVMVYAAIAIVALACYFLLSAADRVRRRMSETSIHILTRIMGMLITALAVQFVATGIKGLGLIPAAH
jgi:multiple antibiotic resistance protein